MGKKVVILSFSGRKGGNCEAISNFIEEFYNRTSVRLCEIDSKSFHACGNCNYECLKPGLICPVLNEKQKYIMDTIIQANIVYFVIPNYCGYPCASYFAFNERSVGYFNMDRALMKKYMDIKKRFIIVSNSENHFADAMKQQTNEEPEILYMKTGKYHKQSITGDLLTSPAARTDLLAFLSAESYL